MKFTSDSYASEPIRYPPLQVVDLAAEGAAVTATWWLAVSISTAFAWPSSTTYTPGTITLRQTSCFSSWRAASSSTCPMVERCGWNPGRLRPYRRVRFIGLVQRAAL